jgi:hypothetical protein
MNHRVTASLLENEKAEISEGREIQYSEICEDGHPWKSATYLGWQNRYSTDKIALIYTHFLTWPSVCLVHLFALYAMVLYTFYPFRFGHVAEKLPIPLHQPGNLSFHTSLVPAVTY